MKPNDGREAAYVVSRVTDKSYIANPTEHAGLFAVLTPKSSSVLEREYATVDAENNKVYLPYFVRDVETLQTVFGDPRVDPVTFADLLCVQHLVQSGLSCYICKVTAGTTYLATLSTAGYYTGPLGLYVQPQATAAEHTYEFFTAESNITGSATVHCYLRPYKPYTLQQVALSVELIGQYAGGDQTVASATVLLRPDLRNVDLLSTLNSYLQADLLLHLGAEALVEYDDQSAPSVTAAYEQNAKYVNISNTLLWLCGLYDKVESTGPASSANLRLHPGGLSALTAWPRCWSAATALTVPHPTEEGVTVTVPAGATYTCSVTQLSESRLSVDVAAYSRALSMYKDLQYRGQFLSELSAPVTREVPIAPETGGGSEGSTEQPAPATELPILYASLGTATVPPDTLLPTLEQLATRPNYTWYVRQAPDVYVPYTGPRTLAAPPPYGLGWSVLVDGSETYQDVHLFTAEVTPGALTYVPYTSSTLHLAPVAPILYCGQASLLEEVLDIQSCFPVATFPASAGRQGEAGWLQDLDGMWYVSQDAETYVPYTGSVPPPAGTDLYVWQNAAETYTRVAFCCGTDPVLQLVTEETYAPLRSYPYLAYGPADTATDPVDPTTLQAVPVQPSPFYDGSWYTQTAANTYAAYTAALPPPAGTQLYLYDPEGDVYTATRFYYPQPANGQEYRDAQQSTAGDGDGDSGGSATRTELVELPAADRRGLHYICKEIAAQRKDLVCVFATPYAPLNEQGEAVVYDADAACSWVSATGDHADLWEYGQAQALTYHDQSFYCEIYWSWVRWTVSRLQHGAAVGSATITVPPSIFVIMNSLHSYRTRGSWHPVAGEQGGVLPDGCRVTQNPALKSTRDRLVSHRINPIYDTGLRGVQIYGNETLNARYTDLSAAHIARTLVLIRAAVDRYSETIKFSLNNEKTWGSWINYVDTKILDPIKARGGLSWTRVDMGWNTTTREEIANRRVNGLVQLQFTQSLEILDLNFEILSSALVVDAD